jgi:holo-[acyl-carrier protein] synthase
VIVGLGVDISSLDRFAAAAARPGFLEKVFTHSEREGATQSLAGRFAVKEALAKALGAPGGLAWHDCVVGYADSGRPEVELRGTVRARADALGVTKVSVSISHDAGVAVAVVICEADR